MYFMKHFNLKLIYHDLIYDSIVVPTRPVNLPISKYKYKKNK